MKILKISLILGLIISSIVSKAQVYVKFDAQGSNNGKSWQDAYTDLNQAIRYTTDDQIWVAKGTYKPSTIIFWPTECTTFFINKNVSLYGGFRGNETNINERDINGNLTLLSGDLGIEGNNQDNTSSILTIYGDNIDSTTVIDGFTIANAFYKNGDDYGSGAVNIYTYGNPIIQNCTIKDNFGFYGGGMYIRYSRALVTNNLIVNNTAMEGAGIYSDWGCYAKIVKNRIVFNKCRGGYSHLAGGAIMIEAYSSPYIFGNLIYGNYAGHYGGGIANESNYAAIISNNNISNNASEYGGGIYIDFSPTKIINNLISNNKAQYGGGLFVDYSPASSSLNNTIVNNKSSNNGSAVFLSAANINFVNTIIHNNTSSSKKPIHISIGRKDWFPKFKFCDIENGKNSISINIDSFWDSTFIKKSNYLDSVWRSGNISHDPLFVDSSSYKYQLSKQSACINSGIEDTSGMKIFKKDLLDGNRILYSRIDMGCYEFDSIMNNNNLNVTPRNINITNGWADSTFVLNISSNMNWHILPNDDWLSLNTSTGSNNADISVTSEVNPDFIKSRTATILISGQQATSQYITVNITQGSGAYLLAFPDTLIISSHENDSTILNIRSNLNWNVHDYPDWLYVNHFSGSKDGDVTIKANVNPTINARTGSLTLQSIINEMDGYAVKSHKVIVVQKPADLVLYPNPVRDILNIFFLRIPDNTFAYIYSASGKVLGSIEINKNESTLDMGSFTKGLYYIKIISPGQMKTLKIIKQ